MFNDSGPFGDGATYIFLHQFWLKGKFGNHDNRALLGTRPVAEGGVYFSYLKLFPMKTLINHPWLPNFILFLCLLLILLVVGLKVELFTYYSIGLCIVIFFSNPDFIAKDDYRMQFFNIQPRYLGVFIGSIIYFIIFFQQNIILYIDPYIIYSIYFLLIYLFLDISVFSRQVYFLIFFPTAIFTNYNLLLICTILPFILRIMKRQFRYKIVAQLKYHIQYYNNRENFFSYTLIDTNNKYIDSIRNLIIRIFAGTTRQLIDYLPIYLISIYFIYYSNSQISTIIIIIPIIVSLIFSLRYFAFMGEGWRYLSFTQALVFPVIFIDILLIGSNYTYVLIITSLFILILLKNLLSSSYEINSNKEIFDIIDNAGEEISNRNIYCIPYRLGTSAVAMGYASKTTEFQFGHDDEDYYNTYFEYRPILNTNEEWIYKTDINLVLSEKNIFNKWKETADNAFLDSMELISQTERYLIYKFDMNNYKDLIS